MPIINITSTPMTTEQKRAYVRRMTEVSMDVLGAPEHAHFVLINELPLDGVGMGKKTVVEMVESKENS